MEEQAPLPCSEKLAFDTQKQAEAAAAVAQYQHGAELRVPSLRPLAFG